MPASIGVNLRVTGHCRQGGRKYMEDFFSVAYQQTEDEKDLEYAFFGIYDGHGGAEAAAFAKEHLMETIIKHKNFWSDNDEDVLSAIKDGYIATHYAMWKEQDKWPKSAPGLPSTAGTTASVAFIRRGKIYIGHVGDSGIILGYQEPGSNEWKAKPLTKDHKPENPEETKRIQSCGGKVVSKSGVPRVVWNRPQVGHQGPVRRSTPMYEIPFLAVARSLGDLWSYNSQINEFVVSPDPDCSVIQIDTNIHRCLIFGTDGLFNMLTSYAAVQMVQQAERHNECAALSDAAFKTWLNPSKLLVEKALEKWNNMKLRADNTSVVTLMLDPPGPPRAQVLKDRKRNLPESGLKIMTRYEGESAQGSDCDKCTHNSTQNPDEDQKPIESIESESMDTSAPENTAQTMTEVKENHNEHDYTATSISSSDVTSNFPLKERNFVPRESTSFDPRELRESPRTNSESEKENSRQVDEDNTIQIHEISSSNLEDLHTENEATTANLATKSTRHSLRSANKSKSPETQKSDVDSKLQIKSDDTSSFQVNALRKSSRLHNNDNNNFEEKSSPAPCTLAEEKLKKLAEDAERSKMKTNIAEKHNKRKLLLTQKILTTKKKNSKTIPIALHKRISTRTKLKLVVNTILPKKKKQMLRTGCKQDTVPATSSQSTEHQINRENIKAAVIDKRKSIAPEDGANRRSSVRLSNNATTVKLTKDVSNKDAVKKSTKMKLIQHQTRVASLRKRLLPRSSKPKK